MIVEPVAGNMGVVLPQHGFLEHLRELTTRNGALLIFDEVMTGFRVHPGGAQALYQIQPDLTTLGKVIGGGLPVGAYGGRREIMSLVAPSGPVYQAGTLSGNPLAMSAGIATLKSLKEPDTWSRLEERCGCELAAGIRAAALQGGSPVQQTRAGTMFTTFFTDSPTAGLAEREDLRYRSIRTLLSRHARAGSLLCPIAIRSWFHFNSSRRRMRSSATLEAAQQVFPNYKIGEGFDPLHLIIIHPVDLQLYGLKGSGCRPLPHRTISCCGAAPDLEVIEACLADQRSRYSASGSAPKTHAPQLFGLGSEIGRE